jgi:hypothetical protein
MPTLDLSRLDAVEEERVIDDEGSRELFDRVAFATRAVEMLRLRRMTVCVCESRSKLTVRSGRTWGREPDESWAIVCVPKTASRRAIALAVSRLGLAPEPPYRGAEPYALDVLLARASEPAG